MFNFTIFKILLCCLLFNRFYFMLHIQNLFDCHIIMTVVLLFSYKLETSNSAMAMKLIPIMSAVHTSINSTCKVSQDQNFSVNYTFVLMYGQYAVCFGLCLFYLLTVESDGTEGTFFSLLLFFKINMGTLLLLKVLLNVFIQLSLDSKVLQQSVQSGNKYLKLHKKRRDIYYSESLLSVQLTL